MSPELSSFCKCHGEGKEAVACGSQVGPLARSLPPNMRAQPHLTWLRLQALLGDLDSSCWATRPPAALGFRWPQRPPPAPPSSPSAPRCSGSPQMDSWPPTGSLPAPPLPFPALLLQLAQPPECLPQTPRPLL